MKLYSEDGKDVWAEHEPDEELQYELEQLEINHGKLLDRLAESARNIAKKKAEIEHQNIMKAARSTPVQY